MDLTGLTKIELLAKCDELGITNCKSKNKSKLIELITKHTIPLHETSAEPLHEPLEIKYVDLFCGLGAFHTAFDFISKSNIKYTC